MAKAGPDEVLVSSTVKDLVVESGIKFKDHGAQAQGRAGEMALILGTVGLIIVCNV
jgi:hypothetical protein